MSERKNILVVANETVAGKALIEAVKHHADQGDVAVHVLCPQNQPRHGHVIYDESVRSAAENRLTMTLAQLKEVGIEADGEIADPDPYSAIKDALGERDYVEIIISTLPETRSGWLRQDLITRVQQATALPVEHVVVDITGEAEDVSRTLVVANQTVGGQALIEKLHELAEERPHRFILICPQPEESGEGAEAERLAHTLQLLQDEGIEAMGQVAHPDPFTAAMHAVRDERIDAILVSTFPEQRGSSWLRRDLVGRLQKETKVPVEHVVVAPEQIAAAP
jgi:hypothetical protein